MSKYLYLLDPGHGGMIGGVYQTSGKRSPRFKDGRILYEGVNNRDNINRLILALRSRNIECIDIVGTNEDISLRERVKRANELSQERSCIYISMHSNASGSNGNWGKAKGNGVYIYPKSSRKTREFAEILSEEIDHSFCCLTKHRGIRERNFYVLRTTRMPAVLLEMGFHDHEEESDLMLTERWKTTLVKSIVNSILKLEEC